MFKFLLRHKILTIFGILVISFSLIAYFMLGKEEKVEYVTAKVERGSLVQTVSETGTVRAASEIDLNFLNTGKVAKVLVKVGDKIAKDQILAKLDYSALTIKEQEAQAKLDKLLAGVSEEEISVSEANVEQARVAYAAAAKELEKVEKTVAEDIVQAEKELNDLELKTDDDITSYEQDIDNAKEDVLTTIDAKLIVANTALDNIDRVVTDEDAKHVLSVQSPSYLKNTKDEYNEVKELLITADDSLTLAKSNKIALNINKAIENGLAALNKTLTALNSCYKALENTIASASFTQAELDALKSNISTQLTNVNTAISAVKTDQQDLDDAILDYNIELDDAGDALATAQVSGEQQITIAENKVDTTAEAWRVAKAKLAQLKAPARVEDVVLAQAALNSVKKQIEDSIIKAPIDGTITKVKYDVGEQTSATQPAVAMLAENDLEIDVDISEADIAKVNVDDPVEITLDAFSNDVKFFGKVYFVEPAETVIQDVIYYKVKITLTPNPSPTPGIPETSLGTGVGEGGVSMANIKSGMTANVIITTARKNNVLIMPSRAMVQKNGGKQFTRLLVNNEIQEVPVVIGMRGDGGMVEVLSGVEEGDEVVTYVKNKK